MKIESKAWTERYYHSVRFLFGAGAEGAHYLRGNTRNRDYHRGQDAILLYREPLAVLVRDDGGHQVCGLTLPTAPDIAKFPADSTEMHDICNVLFGYGTHDKKRFSWHGHRPLWGMWLSATAYQCFVGVPTSKEFISLGEQLWVEVQNNPKAKKMADDFLASQQEKLDAIDRRYKAWQKMECNCGSPWPCFKHGRVSSPGHNDYTPEFFK